MLMVMELTSEQRIMMQVFYVSQRGRVWAGAAYIIPYKLRRAREGFFLVI